MRGGLGSIMKQVQEAQANIQKVQRELADLEVIGESGAGMVRITMNGRHDVKKVCIDDDVLGDDKEMLEDLIAAAMNDAVRKVESVSQEKMSGLTAGFNLPADFKLPF